MKLQHFFQENPQCAVAFSGGVDSAYLLYAARQYGKKTKAYYVKTCFQPNFETEDAKRLANSLGVDMEIIPVDILNVETVTANPPDRCYHCKQALFQRILAAAHRDGFSLVIDGTNASDDAADRPGMQALKELQVRSPLRECGLTKADIRKRSKDAGLFTWDKPSYACLATRTPTGEPITREKLARTESSEEALSQLGLRNFRVRLLGNGAKLEITESDLEILVKYRKDILKELKKYYTSVLVDLEVRDE